MQSKLYEIFLLFLIVLQVGWAKECRLNKLEDCGINESCSETTRDSGECSCLDGFERVNSVCTVVVEDKGGSSAIIYVFLSLFLICLAITIFYLNYKYRLFTLIQYKFHQRYSNNYDDMMIGQEDD